VHSFNIEGNGKVGTSIGTLFSVIIVATMALYISVKGDILVNSRNPLITTTTEYSKRSEVDENGNQETVSIGDLKFQMAFAVTQKHNTDASGQ
jgi:uncharacterized protein YxeA